MNASMNDSHNLGTRLSHISFKRFFQFYFSLEVDACVEKLGKTAVTENRESTRLCFLFIYQTLAY